MGCRQSRLDHASGGGQTVRVVSGDFEPAVAKLVLCGDKATGKSSIVLRFIKDAFADNVVSTIGAAFAAKDVTLGDGTVVKLRLWDTAGEELYRAMTRSFFRDATCSLIVYDVSERRSFESVASWLRDLREQCPDALTLLVSNKVDVDPDRRGVSTSDGAALASSHGLEFFEVSAKTGQGIHEMFTVIASKLADASRGSGAAADTLIAADPGR